MPAIGTPCSAKRALRIAYYHGQSGMDRLTGIIVIPGNGVDEPQIQPKCERHEQESEQNLDPL